MKKLIMGYGENMDTFFVLEDVERKDLMIIKVFYDEFKCREYIKEKNKELGKSLFFDR